MRTLAPAYRAIQLGDGAVTLTWFGRYEERVGPTQECYYGLVTICGLPLLLDALHVRRRWFAFTLNLLSPCCLAKTERLHSPDLTPDPHVVECLGCKKTYPAFEGRTMLNGSLGAPRRNGEARDALAVWSEHFGYDPLAAFLLASHAGELGLESLAVPDDATSMSQDAAFENALRIFQLETMK